MKTYLITGGAGFIGSHFIEYILKTSDSRVVNIDKLTYAGSLNNLMSFNDNPRHIFIKGDISNSETVMSVFQNYDIDVVVNFAAESHVDRSIEDSSPFLKTNVLGTGVLLEAARVCWKDYTNKVFLQISTDEVYGSLEEGVVADESFLLKPGNPYSASKAAADLLVLSYYNTYKLPVLISRCCNNFGPRQYHEKFIPVIIKSMLGNVAIPLYGDGLNKREWIYVKKHCERLVDILELGNAGEIYNIGSGLICSNTDIVKRIREVYCELTESAPSDYKVSHIIDRKGHDRRYALDCKKSERLFGWKKVSGIDDYLKQTVKSYLSML